MAHTYFFMKKTKITKKKRYFEKQRNAECAKHSVNNVLGEQLLTTKDMIEAAEKVNTDWNDYVEKTGFTSGNIDSGWWSDVQQEALQKKGFIRRKLNGKKRLRRMLQSNDKYIIKYHTTDHLTEHYIGVDCSVEPKLILDSELKEPIPFKEPQDIINHVKDTSSISRIYILEHVNK